MDDTTARLSTELLRTSDDQLYQRLRELLIEHGDDPRTDVLADLFEDDVDQEFGVLVSAARRVQTFVLHYGRRGDIKAQIADAVIRDWDDITDRWQSSPYRENVVEAMLLLDDE